MAYQFIRFELEDGVAIVTLNRPDVLNSFNHVMARELQNALAGLAEEPNARAILLRAEGRGFCAGQDLAAVLPAEGQPPPVLGEVVKACYNPIIRLLRNTEKPVVCAVNGVAAGAGANIAFACDLVLASRKASFIQSFCKIGLIPDSGGTFFLPRLVGLPRATALAMLGEKVSAEKAADIGLIYRVCEPETLDAEANELARHLATQPTAGLGYIKRLLNASLTNDLESQLTMEQEMQTLAGQSNDYQEGVAAFIEKRAPVFRGN